MSFLTKPISLSRPSAPRLRKRSRDVEPPTGGPASPSPEPTKSAPPSKGRKSARGKTTITGLEIGATQAIAAEAHLDDGRIVADHVVARTLPLGLMRDGLITDGPRMATELKAFFAEHRLPKHVRVGLATPRTVLRVIDLPPLEEKDIRTALMMQAQERIPMPLESAVLDYQSVGLVDTPEGQRLRLIVVATEREGVMRLLAVLRQAGLKPEGIDLSIFAAIRALRVDRAPGPVLYAQLGDLVNIAIAESGVCRFTRQAPQGLALLLERLAENRAIPTAEAQAVLARVTAEGSVSAAGDEEQEVAELLRRLAIELGSELRAAAEFYATQYASGIVTAGVVAGPLAPLPGFVSALSAASGLELICGEVATAGPDALDGVDVRLAPVACGLAVGELGS